MSEIPMEPRSSRMSLFPRMRGSPIVIRGRGRGRGLGSRGGRISSPPLDRFEYWPIMDASFSELSQWNAEAGPSVPALDREVSLIAPWRVIDQSTLESKTGPRENGGMISSFTNNSDHEIEIVEAPIPTIDLDEYEMVESERETDETMWEDYLILPDSPDSTLPGFGTIISPVVVPDDGEDQIVPSEPVVSPVVPSFNYPSLPDYPLAAFLRENDTIRRGDTPRTDTEAQVIPTPTQWEPYCYTCGEMGHYPRWCRFYHPYGDPVI
ncbi:unnamed protein product [Arabidopsis arenosa]|uniref:CCHC-type domain-containing protein n=1 Tax=Arabidopsis arenosa TaxID=38785 RepID=A0A8S2A725_ARAAE|nr:unnamed protein product [Arabidopsis arenosa]